MAAFIRKADSVLLCRRSSGGSQGMWELPGGKLEPGETPQEALLREIREELSLSCEPGQLLYDGTLPAAEKRYRFMVFETILPSEPASSTAHDCLAWVRYKELDNYQLAPLDVPVLGGLMYKELLSYRTMPIGQNWLRTVPGVQEMAEDKDCRQ